MAQVRFIVAILLTSLPLAFMDNSSSVQCPQLCSCSHDQLVVDCCRAKLSTIPLISASTQVLTLDNNALGTLGQNSFTSLINIKQLSLQNCQLSSINQMAFSGMDSLTSLILSKNKLRGLPEHLLPNSNKFDTLVLSDNQFQLSTLVPALNGLHNLKFLDITNNNMDDSILPKEFADLTELRTLKIGDSTMLELPANYFQALQNTSLFYLSLTGRISNISEYALSDLISLQELNLSGASMTSSDAQNLLFSLGNASDLHTVTMDGVFNKAKSSSIIHKHFFQSLSTTSLKVLSFQLNTHAFNGVLQHKVFKPLHSVTSLYLDGCGLYEVHTDAFHGLTHMKYLSLRGNLLTCSTKSGCGFLSHRDNSHSGSNGFSNLEELDLSYNDIRLDLSGLSFRDTVFPKLQRLHMSNNKISRVHERTFDGLPDLELLDLSRNPIYAIAPLSFSLPQLITLYLNDTSELTALPARPFQGCHMLRKLYLSHSDISTVHPEAFKGLRKLEELYMRNSYLGTDSLANVTVDSPNFWKLDLSENKLTSIPLLVSTQPKLTHLFMDTNYLTDEALRCLGNNTALEVLDLSYNAITHICDSFVRSHSNLSRITLEQNPFYCDCSFQGVGEMFNKTSITVVHRDNHMCSGPPAVKRHSIFTFQPSNWDCKVKGAIIPFICVFVTLLVCGLVIIVRKSGCERPHVEIKDCCTWDTCYFRLNSNMETTDLTDQDSRL